MQLLCIVFFLFLNTGLTAKIYDCFLFYNELEILKIRFEELYDSVNYFVLVESSETFRGKSKPFYFEENKEKFLKYLPKIIHVKVEETCDTSDPWVREAFQRNCTARGLGTCKKNDIILISDADEIPRSTVVKRIKKLLTKELSENIGTQGLVLEQKIYFFQLNRQTPQGLSWDNNYWFGTVVAPYFQFKKFGAESLRIKGRTESLKKIFDAGWHFTYMGGVDGVKAKIQAFSHGQDDVSNITDQELSAWLNNHPARPVDHTFPKYIRDNLGYYQSIGFIGS